MHSPDEQEMIAKSASAHCASQPPQCLVLLRMSPQGAQGSGVYLKGLNGSRCSNAPPAPTAQTSLWLAPQTPKSFASKRSVGTTAPPSTRTRPRPTTQRSLRPDDQAA